MFPDIVMPGDFSVPLLPEIKEYTGSKASLVTVPSHDTASAFLAAPSSSEDAIFLSSGTWSIMGVMADEPVLSAEAMEHGFSNEGGAFGRITLIKNIMGLWIEQESRRQWRREGKSYTFDELSAAAAEAQPLRSLINPFDPIFTPEGNMPQRIAEYCKKTGQAVPASDADYVHCIFYSLANRYKEVLEILKSMSPHPIERLHVIGGGSRNDLLNQLTANAIGIPVLAGPSEATAIGNCLIQAKSAGLLTDCWEMRRLIATAFPPKEFYPER